MTGIWARGGQIGRAAAAALFDWVLPPRCAGCGIIVGAQAGFCAGCYAKLRFISPPCCARCDRPFAQEQGDGAVCGACMGDPPRWHRARAALAYDPLSRGVVLRLKYGRRVALARLAARMMVLKLPDDGKDAHSHPLLLVPVPLHRWRLWQRGFNQAAEISRELARLRPMPMIADALLRQRATPSLRGLGRRQRAQAVSGAFAVNPRRASRICGAHVILVDDVLTSGATADACTRALLRAGAARVDLLVFARVLAETDADIVAIDTLDSGSDISIRPV